MAYAARRPLQAVSRVGCCSSVASCGRRHWPGRPRPPRRKVQLELALASPLRARDPHEVVLVAFNQTRDRAGGRAYCSAPLPESDQQSGWTTTKRPHIDTEFALGRPIAHQASPATRRVQSRIRGGGRRDHASGRVIGGGTNRGVAHRADGCSGVEQTGVRAARF